MRSLNPQAPTSKDFLPDQILSQVDKILSTQVFHSSPILSRFLSFIVRETLALRQNQLKEYTIGVNVLQKPMSFNPKENGIVRIHASRLRYALLDYYKGVGSMDEIMISIPKGTYVPLITENIEVVSSQAESASTVNEPEEKGSLTTVVLPFHYIGAKNEIHAFSDGLASQLSCALTHYPHLSVIGYHITRNIFGTNPDNKLIRDLFDANYIITGDIQSQGKFIRIDIEMIRASNFEIVWSQQFQRIFSANTNFKLQDEIVDLVTNSLEKIINASIKVKLTPVARMHVAS